jgi:transcriptional regulator with XRE-family HTH domain
VVDGAADPGVARAGAAVAARRRFLGISQRELARQKVITAAALIAFEKGRSWPRERTRHTLEELLQWPAGTIARIRAGASVTAAAGATPQESDDVSVVVDMVQVTLSRFDDAIATLPAPATGDFASRAGAILADLRKLESLTARAARHSHGSPAVVRALGMVRGRYDELMLRAAAAPTATLGQRLYAARRRANLTTAEAAAAVGASTDLIEAIEAGEPADAVTARHLEALITELAG